jgi:hypothetical protein
LGAWVAPAGGFTGGIAFAINHDMRGIAHGACYKDMVSRPKNRTKLNAPARPIFVPADVRLELHADAFMGALALAVF